ncbi:MAG TPA: HlyD family secretion protein [Pyrinomonadaceae bacterium]|jgi:membrane fusion protein (multidrug efflux system)
MSEKIEETSGRENQNKGNEEEKENSQITDTRDAPEHTEDNSEETETTEGEEKAGPKKKRNKKPLIIGGAVLLVAAVVGLIYWLYARQFESTDDAFIEGDIVQVSPKISAYISKIYVSGNQFVHKGELLVELDTKDYELRLEQAQAQLRAAQAQRNQSQANVDLTRKTTEASQTQARSNVQTTRSNVSQTQVAANAKQTQIRQAQNAVKTAQAALAQTRAQVPQVEANLALAQKEYNRRLTLYNTGDISKQLLDQALNALQTAQAQANEARKQIDVAQSRVNEAQSGVATAQENYRQALAQINVSESQVGESAGRLEDAAAAPQRIAVSETQVGTSEATIEQAQAAVHQAELELSYTKIYAPDDGYITRKTIEEGQFVQPGAPLMAISQSDEVWVVANFKETQLELMRVGQSVDISVDAYPNETFHGKIESFQAGTGSRFSVLPSENATGNYVKVVQRIPVKIVFNEPPDKVHLLVPGMSVEPRVKVR